MYLGEAMNSFATGVQSGYAFVDNAMNDKQEREAKQLEAKQVAEARAQQIRASQQAVSASEQTQDRLNATETAKMQAIEAIRQDNVGKEIPKLTQQWALGTVNNKDVQNYLANEPYAQKMLGLKDIKSVGEFNQSALEDTTSREYEFMAKEAKYAVDQWKAQVAQGQDGDTEVLGLDAMNTTEQDIVKAYADHFKSIYKQADGQPLNLNNLSIATGAPTKTLSASQRDMEMQLAGLTEGWNDKMSLETLKQSNRIDLDSAKTANKERLARAKNYRDDNDPTAHMKDEKWDRERLNKSIGRKVGGSRSWRNNNPGNLEYSDFAKRHGAIGTDGRFAIFPDYQTGRDAKSKLLFDTNSYKDLTLAQAINRYAPASENNVPAYIKATGANPSMKMSEFSQEQRTKLLDNMQKHEGWTEGDSKLTDYAKSHKTTIGQMASTEADTLSNSDIMTTDYKKEIKQLRENSHIIPALKEVEQAYSKDGVKTGYIDNAVKWMAERDIVDMSSLVGMDLDSTAVAEQMGGLETQKLLKVLSGAAATDNEFARTLNNIMGDKELDEKAKKLRIKTYIGSYIRDFDRKVDSIRKDLPMTAYEIEEAKNATPSLGADESKKQESKEGYASYFKRGGHSGK